MIHHMTQRCALSYWNMSRCYAMDKIMNAVAKFCLVCVSDLHVYAFVL